MRFVAVYFIAIYIHSVYWPFSYDAKLTIMKEKENFICNNIAAKARVEHCMSGIMQDAPAEID